MSRNIPPWRRSPLRVGQESFRTETDSSGRSKWNQADRGFPHLQEGTPPSAHSVTRDRSFQGDIGWAPGTSHDDRSRTTQRNFDQKIHPAYRRDMDRRGERKLQEVDSQYGVKYRDRSPPGRKMTPGCHFGNNSNYPHDQNDTFPDNRKNYKERPPYFDRREEGNSKLERNLTGVNSNYKKSFKYEKHDYDMPSYSSPNYERSYNFESNYNPTFEGNISRGHEKDVDFRSDYERNTNFKKEFKVDNELSNRNTHDIWRSPDNTRCSKTFGSSRSHNYSASYSQNDRARQENISHTSLDGHQLINFDINEAFKNAPWRKQHGSTEENDFVRSVKGGSDSLKKENDFVQRVKSGPESFKKENYFVQGVKGGPDSFKKENDFVQRVKNGPESFKKENYFVQSVKGGPESLKKENYFVQSVKGGPDSLKKNNDFAQTVKGGPDSFKKENYFVQNVKGGPDSFKKENDFAQSVKRGPDDRNNFMGNVRSDFKSQQKLSSQNEKQIKKPTPSLKSRLEPMIVEQEPPSVKLPPIESKPTGQNDLYSEDNIFKGNRMVEIFTEKADGKLSREDCKRLQTALIHLLEDMAEKFSRNQKQPQLKFRTPGCFVNHKYLINCADDFTCNWMLSWKLPSCNGMKLKIQRNLKKVHRVGMKFLGECAKMHIDSVLEQMRKDNKNLETKYWRCLENPHEVKDNIVTLTFDIDDVSEQIIKERGYSLNYKNSKVRVIPLKKRPLAGKKK